MNKTKGVVSPARNTVDRQALAERRKQAIGWYRRGWTQYRIAKRVGVSFEAVSNWVAAYEADGMRGLASLGKPGPKPQVTASDTKKIKAAILRGPEAFGYPTGIWTLERIASVIRKITKANFKTTHTWRLVVSLGFSCQKPESRATERNEAGIRTWRTRTFPPLAAVGKSA